MIYKDRVEAALLLAEKLNKYKGQNGAVIAIPRGGLPVGYILAKHLKFPLDVALTKKIGHPHNKEYAIGSVSLHSRIVSKDEVVSLKYIEAETQRLREILSERYRMYLGDRPPLNLKGKVVIITDDGIATGNTMLATIDLVKEQQPDKVIVAVPVAPSSSIEVIKMKADEVICLQTPYDFYAVGQYYQSFPQVSDLRAVEILKSAVDHTTIKK